MTKKEIKTVNELIQIVLKEKKVLRRKDLIEYVTKDNHYGFSTATRHISNLENKMHVIRRINDHEKEAFGIFDDDAKAVYFILSNTSQEGEHYDAVLKAINSEDSSKRKNAMIEIESIKDIKLFPVHLTKLSDALRIADFDECYAIIRILREHIQSYRIFPSDVDRFKLNVENCFERVRSQPNSPPNLRSHLITLLGMLDDEKLIDYLKEELSSKNPDAEKIAYYGQDYYAAWQIVKHKTDLFKFGTTLPEEKAKILFTLRAIAKSGFQHSPKPDELQLQVEEWKKRKTRRNKSK